MYATVEATQVKNAPHHVILILLCFTRMVQINVDQGLRAFACTEGKLLIILKVPVFLNVYLYKLSKYLKSSS